MSTKNRRNTSLDGLYAHIETEFIRGEKFISLPLGARMLYLSLWCYALTQRREQIPRPSNHYLATVAGLYRHPIPTYLQRLADSQLLIYDDHTITMIGLHKKHNKINFKDCLEDSQDVSGILQNDTKQNKTNLNKNKKKVSDVFSGQETVPGLAPIIKEENNNLSINKRTMNFPGNLQFTELTQKLLSFIQEKHDRAFTQDSFNKAASKMKRFCQNEKMAPERIGTILDWLQNGSNYSGDEFIPRVTSPTEFLKKIYKIEDAMKKRKGTSQTSEQEEYTREEVFDYE